MRRVVLSIEVETVLTVKELKSVEFMSFRGTDGVIRDLPQPPGIETNWRGRIVQVQANQVSNGACP
jgi:hypothetical protein